LNSFGNTLDATVDNSMIGGSLATGNVADKGGGIFILGSLMGEIVVSNQGNTISHNRATGGTTTMGGGGILIRGDSTMPTDVTIEEDIIAFNSSEDGPGGGISIISVDPSITNVAISKTEIGSNSTVGFGGGIGLFGSGIINLFPVVNNVIFKNLALGDPGGGAVAVITSGTDAFFDINLVNNTIADNLSTNFGAQGGGIVDDNTGDGRIEMTLLNGIIYFNSSQGSGNQIALVEAGPSCTPPSPDDCATLSVRASDLSQQPDDLFGTGVGLGFVNLLEGNIPGNPLFVDRLNNDYHIPSISPAADAGSKVAIITVAGIEAEPPP